jgi:hypothetical protein
MTKRAKKAQIYDANAPEGYLLAHNWVDHTPDTRHGTDGFRRFWIPPQWVGDSYQKCPCGWHNADPHYADKTHVVWWHEQIEKLGTLQAVYDDINRRAAGRKV